MTCALKSGTNVHRGSVREWQATQSRYVCSEQEVVP